MLPENEDGAERTQVPSDLSRLVRDALPSKRSVVGPVVQDTEFGEVQAEIELPVKHTSLLVHMLVKLLPLAVGPLSLAGLSYTASHFGAVQISIGFSFPLLAPLAVLVFFVWCWCIASWTIVVYEGEQTWRYHIDPSTRPKPRVGWKPNQVALPERKSTRWSMFRRRLRHLAKRFRYAGLGIPVVMLGLVPVLFTSDESMRSDAETAWYFLVHHLPLWFGVCIIPCALMWARIAELFFRAR